MSKKIRAPKPHVSSPTLDPLDRLRVAAAQMKASKSRYGVYDFLCVVYRHYWNWSKQEIVRRQVKALAQQSNQSSRNDHHTFRTMLIAANCSPEAKVLSRWTRALEYAREQMTRPDDLLRLFKSNGGVAGCARLAAREIPKHRTTRNSWL
jgi:hypothetical protein